MPTLNSSFDENLKSHVLYEVTSKGSIFFFVGQTKQNVSARIFVPQQKYFHVAQHLLIVVAHCKIWNGTFWRLVARRIEHLHWEVEAAALGRN